MWYVQIGDLYVQLMLTNIHSLDRTWHGGHFEWLPDCRGVGLLELPLSLIRLWLWKCSYKGAKIIPSDRKWSASPTVVLHSVTSPLSTLNALLCQNHVCGDIVKYVGGLYPFTISCLFSGSNMSHVLWATRSGPTSRRGVPSFITADTSNYGVLTVHAFHDPYTCSYIWFGNRSRAVHVSDKKYDTLYLSSQTHVYWGG